VRKNMESNTYIVAGHHEWCRQVFEELRHEPGVWLFVAAKNALTAELVHSHKPKFIFFLHWSYIVPGDILALAQCVCFHMTDVPYGRGGSPLQNLILRDHKKTKISALRMTAELDAGPVYAKAPLTLEGTARDILNRSGKIVVRMIRKILTGKLQPVPQFGEPLLFKRRNPSQSLIPPAQTIEKIYDFIRMLDADGYPNAFLIHEGFRYAFHAADLRNGKITATVEISVEGEKK